LFRVDARYFQLVRKERGGLVEWLIGQTKRAPMAGYGELRFDVLMNLDCVAGVEVYGMHEPSGAVRADGDHGDVESAEALADLAKYRRVAGVAGEVSGMFRALHHPAAPMSAIPVERGAGRAVLGWDGMDHQVFGELCGLPPGEFVTVGDAPSAKPRGEPLGNPILHSLTECAHRGQVKVIVVGVADQNVVDRREIFKSDAWWGNAPQVLDRDGLNITEDGVGEDVDALVLNQERGVTNPGDADF